MNKPDLLSYASSFASFLLRREDTAKKINKIILFGSVARGDFDTESDVDIFIDTKEDEKEFQKILKLFNASKEKEFWELNGVKNAISLKIGKLKEWKLIKRAILTDGIVLYGKYENSEEKMEHFALFKVSFEKVKKVRQIAVWRQLYGYSQKVGEKKYETNGLIKELGGRKIEKSVFLIPILNIQKAYAFFRKYKINYEVFEIWSDSF